MSPVDNGSFIVTREDWSLHRKGDQDQVRRQQKAHAAIKQYWPVISNLGMLRTIIDNLRRNASYGQPGIYGISPDDLRNEILEDIIKPHSNAVILAMMDTSVSMGAA